MQTFELKGEVRSDLGKKATKALRSEGNVPCVLYGGNENVHFTVSDKQLSKLLYTPFVYLLKLEVNGKSYDAILKDVQYHPVSDKTLHVDFYQIEKNKPVVMEVPVKLHGFSQGVQAGGKLVLITRKVKVKALPEQLPGEVAIDVTNLGLGKSVKVKELSYDDFEIVNAKDVVVVQVKMTRAARAAEAAQGK